MFVCLLCTFLALKLFIGNVIGFIVEHWKYFLYGVLVITVLFVLFFAYKGCSGQRTVKIDTEAINKINNANEEKRKKELKEIVIGKADM